MDLAKYRARVLNTYALVAYLPEPLASFLDGLSRALVPGCKPRAHITLLPPRHLSGSFQEAKTTLDRILGTLAPFELEITTIEIFDATSVIYADIGDGREHLLDLHLQLNVESLAFREQFPYHPHVTLAIHAESGNIHDLLEVAKLEWAAYEGPRRFRIEELHFVYNEAQDCWTDVAAYSLEASPRVQG
jgi:2'-5' RNA ligase